ncbi:hypothetical protein AYO38_08735 [bacterium SCGC AG-212-C10]|nr:hypothetical protein AYO38_08735 [bacterium SCGC AG-212-C10]
MKRIPVLVAALLVLNFVAVGVIGMKAFAADDEPAAPSLASPLGTAFTYQGKLTGTSGAITGACDLRFTLFDQVAGGMQIEAPVEKLAVPIVAGVFSTKLDFGDAAFSAGQARFISIFVRCPAGVGTFEPLAGRQELTSTPYAQFANHAPWAGLTNVPDGVGAGTPFDNVIVVAKSGGDFTSIQAAINSVQSNAGDRYLVWVAPGTYNERVTVTAYVDLVGAGRDLTIITASSGTTRASAATVTMNVASSLRSLTVENTGGPDSFAVGMYTAQGGTVTMDDVAVSVGGAANSIGIVASVTWVLATNCEIKILNAVLPSGIGAVLENGGISTFREVAINAAGTGAAGVQITGNTTYLHLIESTIVTQGPNSSIGIVGTQAGYVEVDDTTIHSSGTGSYSIGISLVGGITIIRDSTITAVGSLTAVGVEAYSASPSIDRTLIRVSQGTGQNVGVRHQNGASPSLTDVTIYAQDAQARAVTNTAGDGANPAAIVRINRSILYGPNNSVGAFTPNITYRIGGSMLDGPKGSIGTYICTNSYNGAYVDLGPTC